MPAPGLLLSPLLTEHRIPHAFTTRTGGISSAPFDSLNFGNPMDLPHTQPRDPVSNINENFRLVLAAIGAPAREVVEVYQVHGNTARIFRAAEPSRERRSALPHEPPDDVFDFKADALITDDPTRTLAVRVADCCPILLATPDGSIVAAIHAGWRGVASNILRSAISAMHELAPHPELLAAIGPCIGPTQFEVGPEVVDQFHRSFGHRNHIRPHTNPAAAAQGKAFIHMQSALREQLETLGLNRIDTIEACTASDPSRFFSHRRDKGVTGRMIGIIGPK
ncbi:MAG: peptidoglycan editing factor PgeF [Phycisphaerales bacterium]|nr:peptidoglycan editing factor PgeF [Phycisphaerales bacterium]